MTNITKESIDTIIEDFKKKKDLIKIDNKNLKKFNKDDKFDKFCYSFIEGQGGYYVKFLKYLVENIKPRTIVELGSQKGFSTLSIYDALKNIDSHFYTIDLEKDQRYCPDEMFKDTKVSFLFGDVCSVNILKKVPFDINLLFTDTAHFKDQIEDEFEVYQYLLSDIALVAVDDIHLNDKGEFWDKLSYQKWDLTNLCHETGWGLFIFERKEIISKEERYVKMIEVSARIWERKYNEQFLENNRRTSMKLVNQVKGALKKITPLYTLYTDVYNRVYFLLKNK